MENKLILHRGFKGKYLENSKISFENALKQGFDFETDVRLSKDNIPFMIHDDSLDRLFNDVGKVSEKDSTDLKQCFYKEDENEKLCSLTELCELIKNIDNKDSKIFIHIKELKDIYPVIEILEKYDFNNRIYFFSCDDITLNLIDIIKEKYPKYNGGLHYFENNSFNKQNFKKADFVWADEINKKNITKELVELTSKLDKPIYAISPELIPESIFNSDIKKRWKEFLEINIDGICTDKPDEFLEFISSL